MTCAFKATIAAVLLVLSAVAPVLADPFDDAVAAHHRGDYATAYQLQLPLADQGNAKAQVNIGLLYSHGQGVPQNDVEAVKWFSKAAEQSDAFAQHNLGVMYESGRGVPQDRIAAARWYQKAADQGLADAQYDLGQKYANGHGVPQDWVRACMWFSLSAAQGHEYAAIERASIVKIMTPAQIAEAQKLAREWKPTAPTPR